MVALLDLTKPFMIEIDAWEWYMGSVEARW
jgi:hypothetical protein